MDSVIDVSWDSFASFSFSSFSVFCPFGARIWWNERRKRRHWRPGLVMNRMDGRHCSVVGVIPKGSMFLLKVP